MKKIFLLLIIGLIISVVVFADTSTLTEVSRANIFSEISTVNTWGVSIIFDDSTADITQTTYSFDATKKQTAYFSIKSNSNVNYRFAPNPIDITVSVNGWNANYNEDINLVSIGDITPVNDSEVSLVNDKVLIFNIATGFTPIEEIGKFPVSWEKADLLAADTYKVIITISAQAT